jgi:hypothetical protein
MPEVAGEEALLLSSDLEITQIAFEQYLIGKRVLNNSGRTLYTPRVMTKLWRRGGRRPFNWMK